MAPRQKPQGPPPRDPIQTRSRTIQKRRNDNETPMLHPQRRLTGTNYLIVRQLTHLMGVRSLIRNRLVHPLWDDLCTMELNRKASLRSSSFKRLQKFAECFDTDLGSQVSKTWKCSNALNMASIQPSSMRITTRFFDNFGHSITKMSFSVRFKLEGEMSRFQYLLSQLPNLSTLYLEVLHRPRWTTPLVFPEKIPLPKVKKLSISFKRLSFDFRNLTPDDLTELGILMGEDEDSDIYKPIGNMLIDTFPNVEALQLTSGCNVLHCYHYFGLFQDVNLDPQRFIHLQKLFMPVDLSTINHLTNTNLRFKTLSLEIMRSDSLIRSSWTTTLSTGLAHLLQRQASTLQDLSLYISLISCEIIEYNEPEVNGQLWFGMITAPLSFPICLPNLISFKLYVAGFQLLSPFRIRLPIEPINYKQLFPKLEAISIFGNDFHVQKAVVHQLLIQSTPSDTLKNISYNLLPPLNREWNPYRRLRFKVYAETEDNYMRQIINLFPKAIVQSENSIKQQPINWRKSVMKEF